MKADLLDGSRPVHRLLLAGLLGLAGWPAACSSSGDGSGGGQDAGGGGQPCTTDDQCIAQAGVGHVCEQGGCVLGCALPGDCLQLHGAGWTCRSMHCVLTPTDAGTGEPTDGAAPDQGPPVPICDPPCSDRQSCYRGMCVDRCQAPLPCPAEVTADLGGVTIDAYEASRPDATDQEQGCNSARACTAAGRLPWVDISWTKAGEACAAAGKRLCTAAEWRSACHALQGFRFPYGNSYDGTACNDAGGALGTIWPTGRGRLCVTPQGVFDLAGNAAEWIADELGNDQRGTLGGSFMSNMSQVACDYALSLEATSYRWGGLGFRCCK